MGYGLFFALAGLILAAALGVVLNTNPVRSALSLAALGMVCAWIYAQASWRRAKR